MYHDQRKVTQPTGAKTVLSITTVTAASCREQLCLFLLRPVHTALRLLAYEETFVHSEAQALCSLMEPDIGVSVYSL